MMIADCGEEIGTCAELEVIPGGFLERIGDLLRR
jgi:hypothetical protein